VVEDNEVYAGFDEPEYVSDVLAFGGRFCIIACGFF